MSKYIALIEGQYQTSDGDQVNLVAYKAAFKLSAEQIKAPLQFIRRNLLIESYLNTKVPTGFDRVHTYNLIALFPESDRSGYDGISPRWLGADQIKRYLADKGQPTDFLRFVPKLEDKRELILAFTSSDSDKRGYEQLRDILVSRAKATEDELSDVHVEDPDSFFKPSETKTPAIPLTQKKKGSPRANSVSPVPSVATSEEPAKTTEMFA